DFDAVDGGVAGGGGRGHGGSLGLGDGWAGQGQGGGKGDGGKGAAQQLRPRWVGKSAWLCPSRAGGLGDVTMSGGLCGPVSRPAGSRGGGYMIWRISTWPSHSGQCFWCNSTNRRAQSRAVSLSA